MTDKKKKLVIVESPAKCKKIESILGKDYICKASYGHIMKLKNILKVILKILTHVRTHPEELFVSKI